MKKKYLLLALLIFFLTGCQAEYNLTIHDNIMEEDLLVYENDLTKWDNIQGNNITTYAKYYEMYKDAYIGIYYNDQNVDGEDGLNPNRSYYDISSINTNTSKGLELKGNFTLSKYEDSYLLKNCYDNVNVLTSNNQISIATSDEFTCLTRISGIDKVVIKIKTNYEVIDSNASTVNDNVLTWTITKNNYKNSNIYIKLDKEVVKSSSTSESKNENDIVASNFTITYLIIIIIFLILLYVVYKAFKKKSIEKNRV